MELTERQFEARLRLGSKKGRACSTCGEFKGWEDFSTVPKNSTGRHSRCKGCQNKAVKKLRKNRTQEQVEEQAEQQKAKRAARTPEEEKAAAKYNKEYSQKNKKKQAKYDKKRRDARTPEEIEETAKRNKAKWDARTPEQIEETVKYNKTRHDARTPEEIEERAKYNKAYRANNKEHFAAYSKTPERKLARITHDHKRRFLKQQQADGTIPTELTYPLAADLQALYDGQRGRCNDCGAPLEQETGHDNSQHLDHHEPLSKGGAHSIGNVVWLCRSCNLTKSAKTPTAPLTFRIFAA